MRLVLAASLTCAAVAGSALAFPADLRAATLLSVGQVDGHLTATWSPGGENQVIQAATSPAMGSDGDFFDENRKLFDLVPDWVTSYTASRRLPPGTYYVAVQQWSDSCLCSPPSNVLTVTIPNKTPAIRGGSWQALRNLRTGSASIELCDDEHEDAAPYRVVIRQERLLRGRVRARASSTDTDTIFGGGCGSLSVGWSIPKRLIRVGHIYRVTFTIFDPFGATASRTVSGRWR